VFFDVVLLEEAVSTVGACDGRHACWVEWRPRWCSGWWWLACSDGQRSCTASLDFISLAH